MVVKIVLDEDHSEEARALLNDYSEHKFSIYAPSILIFEVASALSKLVKLRIISKDYSFAALGKLAKVPFTLIDLANEELVETLAKSIESKITFYDALYITVSEKTHTILVTADEDMVKKAGTYTKVTHIINYKK